MALPTTRPRTAVARASQPLYEQAYAELGRQIREGHFRPGSRLPSERALGASLGMSRLPIRRALTQLVSGGLVARRGARGWFVAGEDPLSEPAGRLLSFTAMARERGLTASSVVISKQAREASIEESESLRIAPGAPVFELQRQRLLESIPVAVDVVRLPLLRAAWIEETDFSHESLHDAFEAHGIFPHRAECTVEVVEASPEQAELLGVTVGKGLLAVSSRTFDRDDAPIELNKICYRPDRYRFRTHLFRA
jgi:GntR family transcriptional regulator